MPDNDLARRMFLARNHLERELGRGVTLEKLGELIAEHLGGRDEPIAGSVVARWLKGQQEPRSRAQWEALAKALKVDPGWLTYGTGSMTGATLPAGPIDLPFSPATDYRATPAELAEAREEADREARRSAAKGKKNRKSGGGR